MQNYDTMIYTGTNILLFPLLSFCLICIPTTFALQIVVFSCGDLRVRDHPGLTAACLSSNNVLPLFVVAQDQLKHLPDRIHTPLLIESALGGLSQDLTSCIGQPLHVLRGFNFLTVLSQFIEDEGKEKQSVVTLHYFNAGPAENDMNYNAFNSIESLDMPNIVKKPWSSFIIDGSDAYNNDKMDFPSFKSSNLFRRGKRSMPLSIPSKITLSSSTTTMEIKLPTAQELNNGEPISESNSKSGLWLSHFGNFNEGKVTEKSVHEALDFASKNDENVFLTKYAKPRNKILARSLEHAAMERMSAGCTDCKDLINDEALLRVLLAPLLLGSLSTKQLYHYGAANNNQNLRNSAISKDFHRILAGMPQNRGDENYEYVMFNGQLTRFSKRRTDNHNKESAIFIHGFGASGYQFQPLIKALTRAAGADSKSKFPSKLFALDLLGFGQSEKPALTYTQYLWEAQVAHFCDFAAEGEVSEPFGKTSIRATTKLTLLPIFWLASLLLLQKCASCSARSSSLAGIQLVDTAQWLLQPIITLSRVTLQRAAEHTMAEESVAKDSCCLILPGDACRKMR